MTGAGGSNHESRISWQCIVGGPARRGRVAVTERSHLPDAATRRSPLGPAQCHLQTNHLQTHPPKSALSFSLLSDVFLGQCLGSTAEQHARCCWAQRRRGSSPSRARSRDPDQLMRSGSAAQRSRGPCARCFYSRRASQAVCPSRASASLCQASCRRQRPPAD